MRIFKLLVLGALMFLSLYLFVQTGMGQNAQAWVALYWLTVFIKWMVDFVDLEG